MNREELHQEIFSILEREKESVDFSYNDEMPYQTYERIGFEGRRWSVEKRIAEYGLEPLFDPGADVLDIGSNFGFFVCEFAHHCKSAHGIEQNRFLNEIGRVTADFLGVSDRTKYFDVPFEKFNEPHTYDRIFTFAAFYTTDKNQRSSAEDYFGKINNLLNPGGILFYESTSYPLEENSPDRGHYLASREAIRVISEQFDVEKSFETPSGAYHRHFMLAKKRV